jgi:uncharacterized membrane protein YcgQ (UPF0703/DUF1980 family)
MQNEKYNTLSMFAELIKKLTNLIQKLTQFVKHNKQFKSLLTQQNIIKSVVVILILIKAFVNPPYSVSAVADILSVLA